jgi:RNA polymerase sigma factor (sigma-70 family)
MGVVVAGTHHSDQRMVAGVRAGDPSCVKQFLDIAERTIWPAMTALVGEGPGADETFLSIISALSENGFQRLARYDGRSSLSTFLVLLTRDLIGEDVQRLLAIDHNRAWRRFDRMFRADINRKIRNRFSRADVSSQEDVFQEVSKRLVDDNYHRIRQYDGKGSFCGYILVVVGRILIDIMRGEKPRRRLPVEIKRMSKLHQLLYAAGAWHGIPLDPDRMAEVISGKITPAPDRPELNAALKRLATPIALARANVPPQHVPIDGEDPDRPGYGLPADDADPEIALMEKEQQEIEQAFIEQVQRQAELLSPDRQHYLHIILQASDPTPRREIARQMAVLVEEIDKLEKKTLTWSKQIAEEVRKNARLSV